MKIDGSKLKFQMAIHYLTQKKLSKKSGLSTYTVFNALNSKNVRPMTAGLIAEAIGVEEGKILEEE